MLFMPVVGMATDGAPDIGGYFSWEGIGTFAGAVALVVFIVQALKLPLDRVWRIPTKYVVYVVSLCVLLLAQAYVPPLGGLTLQSAFLCMFNAFLVSLTAMATYENIIHKPEFQQMIMDGVSVEVEDGHIIIKAANEGIIADVDFHGVTAVAEAEQPDI